ncbi:unnamed protein product [Schistocephalus solidus]|uniref:Uncharacterized protein n=1 Tax=Schistocephalus solidus TaxID=70667 RepID=A0A183SGS0_SCHSO|nr:unnamed protein product [Schistocephalus solidus]
MSHPSVLQFPQPLLLKMGLSIEDFLVYIGRTINVRFLQPVLLGRQGVTGCVVVIEPALVLNSCASEDIQGGGLDCVPQLAPAVLHEGVLVGDWEVS